MISPAPLRRTTLMLAGLVWALLALASPASAQQACVVDADCDDAVSCTVDTCVSLLCQNTADDTVCDNGLFCDGAETCDPTLDCQAGTAPPVDDGVTCTIDSCDEVADVVVNAPDDTVCDNGLFCDGAETCDPTLDCQAGTAPPVDDGVTCTIDSCDEVADLIVNTPDDTLCDNGLFCDGAETCDPTLDCQAGTAPPVDDGVSCTIDSCDEVADLIVNTPDDTVCDNGLFCDGAETCDPTLDCQAGTAPPVDDGVTCTIDSCDEVADLIVNTPDDTVCDNGLFCDGAETCDPTLDCQAGTAPPVDDGVTCTIDSCDEVADVVVNAPDDTVCDNGLFCDGAETCDPTLDCQAGTAPPVDDGVTCTIDSCDEVADVVVNAPDDTVCDNGLFCDGAETCDPTLDCQAGAAPPTDDGVSCTVDACDEATDTITNTASDALCDNGLFCDGAETCDPTLDCQAGTAPPSDDGVSCTIDGCDEATDTITNTPDDTVCDNGLFCDGAETCDPTLDCQLGTPPPLDDGVSCTVDICDEGADTVVHGPADILCDNGQFCDGSETCDPVLDCQAGTPVDPDDGVGCTADSCDEVNDQIVNAPDDTVCDNGLFCDGAETCDPTLDCQAGPPPADDGVSCTVDFCDEATDLVNNVPNDAVCDNGLFCDGSEVCDLALDCQAGPPPGDDGVGCTVDFCDEASDVISNVPNDALCDNGLFCDGVETCDATLDCQTGPAPGDDGVSCTVDGCDEATDTTTNTPSDALCDNGLFCDGAEVCDPTLDCQAGTPVSTDDGVGCTVDGCDEASDTITHVANDSLCDNGQFCDGAETCDATLDCQAGTAPPVDDGVGCTVDGCDETNDVIIHTGDDSLCDNGLFCDGAETCDPTLDCQAGTAPGDDGVSCTVDGCDEATDTVTNTPDDTACDNGLFCDGAETCDPTLDCQAGTPVDPDDGVGCTTDSCDEATDTVTNTPDDTVCDNGLFCDGAETCDPALDCQAGTAPPSDDGVSCTIDGCDEATDAITNTPDDTVCDNGLFCDGTETCDATLDCQAGTAPPTDDGVSCTVDGCDEATDTVTNTPDDTVCDNGLFCDGAETCDPTLDCQVGAAPPSDDGVSCTIDGCDEATDTVTNTPDDTACDNGLFCDGSETCDATLDCQAGTAPPTDDGVSCTVDGCDEATDTITNTASDALCDNGLFCDGAETCDPTLDCQAGTAPPLDDGVSCTVDICDEAADQVVHGPADILCDNGQFCDGSETCDPVLDCQVGTPVNPDDGVGCTADSCDEVNDLVVNAPDDSVCDNGLFCDGAETCDPALDCQAAAAPATDDGVGCTIDACDEATDTVTNTPDDTACDNGLFCDGAEICDPTFDCQPGPSPPTDDGVACTVDNCDEATNVVTHVASDALCDNGLFCDGAETCDATLDCQAGSPPSSDDGIGCTIDGCDEANDLLVNLPTDALCDNGLFCDGSETCDPAFDCQPGTAPPTDDGVGCTVDGCDETADVVTHVATDALCDNGLFCDGAETCDPALDCRAGTAPATDDGVSCTVDSCDDVADVVVNAPDDGLCDNGLFCDGAETCDPTLDCQAGILEVDGTVCDDGNFCSSGESCQAGACTAGVTTDCSSLDGSCQVGFCNPANQACEAATLPDSTPCSDGDVCTTVDICLVGICAGTTPLSCDDGNFCTADQCDSVSGCFSAPIADGTVCDDGDLCTVSDSCTSGLCGGPPRDCDDADACTADACDSVTGCFSVPTPDGDPCEDGAFCTEGDICQAGVCIPGSPRDCSGVGDDCNFGLCDDVADACVADPLPDGTLCTATLCTEPDTCQTGACVAGPPRSCDDNSVCTADACDANLGCVNTPLPCDDGDACTIDSCDPFGGCSNVLDPDDTDADGTPDACDVCPADADDDIDGDGVCANIDNCDLAFNPSQNNVDGDSFGNACDPDTVFVDGASACTPGSCAGCGGIAQPYATIQDAISCESGATAIVVQPGTYLENLVLDRRIHLESAAGPAVTTIEGGGTERTIVLDFGGTGSKVVQGFTISSSGSGGGIETSLGNIQILDNVITNHTSAGDGAAISVLLSTGRIEGNVIAANQSNGNGGAIALSTTTVDVIDNLFQGNESRLRGGAVYSNNATSDLERNRFETNLAGTDGGAFAVEVGAPTLRDNVFSGNVANTVTGGRGGAVYVVNSAARLFGNDVSGNTAALGGALYAEEATPTLRGNRFDGNLAFGGGGGAVAMRNVPPAGGGSSAPNLSNNFFAGNISTVAGGGLWCESGTDLEVVNNTFVDNGANVSGGSIYLGACTATLTNNLIGRTQSGGGLFCGAGSTVTSTYNNLWGNVGGDYQGLCAADATDFATDPNFVASACTNEVHVAPGSPVIDVGDNLATGLPVIDIDGGNRIQDGDFDFAAVVDIGADEFSCADLDGDGLTACTTPRDCDDSDPTVSPYAQEICDGIDNDCDCVVDEGVSTDGDGDGVSTCGGDCNDGDGAILPGAPEVCDGIDNNCNGAIDEGFADVCVDGALAALQVGAGIGLPGDQVGFAVTLSIDPSVEVSATSNDLLFVPEIVAAAPVCTLNPAILGKTLSQNPQGPGSERVLVAAVNNLPIPAGDLYTCTVDLDAAAPAGTYALRTQASSSDPSGTGLPTNGLAGSLTVLPAPGSTPTGGTVGDCSGNGSVDVAELQTVINIFSGADVLASCPAADANGDGIVDVTELQITINNHLGL